MLDIAAVGAHPDDVELFAGGTLARALEAGRKVGIIHLTRGEMGSRGSAEERHREALAAADVLGVPIDLVAFLDLGDTQIDNTRENQLEIIRVLRRWRPRLVLSHHPQDRHPDHRKASQLVEDALFYAGLYRIETDAPPWRPPHRLRFFNNSAPDALPTIVVDISPFFDRKMAAIAAYASQFYNPEYDGPSTWLSSPEFHEQIQLRARYFGGLVGASHGEPFDAVAPLPANDLAALFR